MSDVGPAGLRAGWYRTPTPAEGEITRLVHGDHEAVVWQADGSFHALEAWCPHRGADLGGGRVDGEGITCPLHGWRWAPDGRNLAMGPDPAHPDARCTPVPVATGALGPLVWLSSTTPHAAGHPCVDLADRLPGSPTAVHEAWYPIQGMDPTLFIENGFDVGHVAVVHGGPGPEVVGVSFEGDLAQIDLSNPLSGNLSSFVVYRGSQILAHVATSRPEVNLWILGTVEVGERVRFSLRYEAHGPGADAVLRRFVRHHHRETELDLALLSTVRRDRGRWWGPRDGPLQDFRTWVDGFEP